MLPQAFTAAIARDFPPDFLVTDPRELETLGRDWTRVFTPKPSGAALPRTTDEVSRLLRLCSEHGVRVVPSGGRTGLAGGAVASDGELVLSLTRMSKMGPVDPLAHTVRVQAGAVTEAVHKHCEPHGLTWPIDFAAKGSSQIGGNISTNAGGVKVIHYGMSRQWVLGLQAVLMDGTVLELNGALEKNNTGLDLRQLFIGTEGTLGVITEATLKLARLPKGLAVFFFALDDIASVFKLFLEARRGPFTLMAFECLTHRCLEAVQWNLGVQSPFKEASGAYALMEVEHTEPLDEWLTGLFEKALVKDGTLAQSPREARDLWKLREGISESLARKGFVHKNDIALPVAGLEAFIGEMNALFERRDQGSDLYLFGHIGDGNLHVNTMKPEAMEKDAFIARCKEADQELFALVRKHKGSISAEHGIGLLKKAALSFTRSPEELALLRAVKKSLDPRGLLNPGKVFD